jgi:uncharacterized membrane protein
MQTTTHALFGFTLFFTTLGVISFLVGIVLDFFKKDRYSEFFMKCTVFLLGTGTLGLAISVISKLFVK